MRGAVIAATSLGTHFNRADSRTLAQIFRLDFAIRPLANGL
jgi:hypothetical protein